jgi:hypothetical protein
MSRSRMRRGATLLALLLSAPALISGVGPRQNLEERLLAVHNRERDAIGAPALKWDPALARSARDWAEYLARSGKFEHSPDGPWYADPEGENLWAGTVGYYQPESMVGLWTAEKRHFKQGVFPDNSRDGRVEKVSHYTQLIWSRTGSVGCALAPGQDEDVLVCRYTQAGNVLGERPI